MALVVVQGLWYALSCQPWINDEARHFQNIVIYSHHLSPFLGSQNPAWDHLGEVTRDGSFMFYYVMSWPLRLIRLFSGSAIVQLIGLRFVCAAFFIGGLWFYRKALLELKAPRSVVNVMLLFFVTIPAVALLPGTVNYDNLVFLLFGLILFLALRVLNRSNVSFLLLVSIAIAGLFMSVVKWSSIGLFVPVVLYVIYDQLSRFGRSTFRELLRSAKRLPRWSLALVVVGLIVTAGLFIERPVLNTLRYGNPEPACQDVISAARCEKFPDYVNYSTLEENKPADFHPYDPVRYTLVYWVQKMVDTTDNLQEQGRATEIPTIKYLYGAMAAVGIIVILIYLRDLIKDRRHQLLFTILILYTATLILHEYQAYLTYGVAAAIRARYLVQVLPLFMYFIALSFMYMFGRYRKMLLVVAIGIAVVCSQGAGIITYSLTSPARAYWPNRTVRSTNGALKDFFSHFVKQ